MAYTLVQKTIAASANNDSVTTSAIDTTGANLIVIVLACFIENTLSDSNGNIYTKLTLQSGSGVKVVLAYKYAPIVGSGHTFTADTSTNSFPSLAVYSFSGSVASPFDLENGTTTASQTTAQPGSVTPSEDNELLVTGICWGGTLTGPGIDSGFSTPDTILTTATNMPIGGSYKIQTSAGLENPTWSWTSNNFSAVAIATFKSGTSATLMGQILT